MVDCVATVRPQSLYWLPQLFPLTSILVFSAHMLKRISVPSNVLWTDSFWERQA